MGVEKCGPQGPNRGLSKSREYGIWNSMTSRCHNPNNKAFKWYGGRGIKVSARWKCFQNFVEDMHPFPQGMTLERVDNDGDYCKENCIWESKEKQALNKRNNRLLTFNGVTQPLAEWSKQLGLKRTTITQRLDAYGWSLERTLTTF